MSAESTPSAIDFYRACVDEIDNERPPLRTSRIIDTPSRHIGRGSSQDPEIRQLSRPHPYRASARRLIDHPRGSQNTVTERTRISYLEGSKGVDVSGGNFVTADGDFIGEIVYNAGVTINNYSSSAVPSAAPHVEETEVTIGGEQAPLPIQRTCDVYNRHLACKGRGFPLWIPEPNNNLSMDYRRRGIDIGDVGIITKMGNFDFLFNICLPEDHPINRDGVPVGFSPCKPLRSSDIQRYTEFEAGAFLTSTSVDHSRFEGEFRNSTLIFESSAMEGAILTMPDGAETLDLSNMFQFERYMAKNVASWYRYVLVERGRHAENGDVRLVVGRDNSRTWGMATFEKASTCGDALRLKFGPLEDNALGTRRYAWDSSGAASARTGPSHTQIEELSVDGNTDVANQTLFVRTLNARLKSKTWKKLTTAISEELTQLYEDQECYNDSSHNSVSSPPSSEGTSTTSAGGNPGASRETMVRYKGIANIDSNPESARISHPADIINELALEKTSEDSDAFEMIITNDKDWMSVVTKNDPTLPSGEELFDRILKHQAIQLDTEDGFVFFSPDSETRAMDRSMATLPWLNNTNTPMPSTPSSSRLLSVPPAPKRLSMYHGNVFETLGETELQTRRPEVVHEVFSAFAMSALPDDRTSTSSFTLSVTPRRPTGQYGDLALNHLEGELEGESVDRSIQPSEPSVNIPPSLFGFHNYHASSPDLADDLPIQSSVDLVAPDSGSTKVGYSDEVVKAARKRYEHAQRFRSLNILDDATSSTPSPSSRLSTPSTIVATPDAKAHPVAGFSSSIHSTALQPRDPEETVVPSPRLLHHTPSSVLENPDKYTHNPAQVDNKEDEEKMGTQLHTEAWASEE